MCQALDAVEGSDTKGGQLNPGQVVEMRLKHITIKPAKQLAQYELVGNLRCSREAQVQCILNLSG